MYAHQQLTAGGASELHSVHSQTQLAIGARDRLDVRSFENCLDHAVQRARQTPRAVFQAGVEIAVIAQIDAVFATLRVVDEGIVLRHVRIEKQQPQAGESSPGRPEDKESILESRASRSRLRR